MKLKSINIITQRYLC